MKYSDYELHVSDFTNEMNKVTTLKNHDYSIREDAMDNFKMVGEILGISPTLVWSVLWMKHVTAVVNHMAKGKTLKDETIHGRFIDLANYAMLGDALVKDLATNSPPEIAVAQNAVVEYMFYIDGQLEQIQRRTGPGAGLELILKAMRARTKAFLETFPRDQHGSPQSVEPVSRHPSDVQDEASDQRTDGKSNVGPDTPTYPTRASKRPIHS